MYKGLTMKPGAKKLWVDSLRSGTFEQGQNYLYDGRGYCCLGVFASVNGKEVKKDPHGSSEHVMKFVVRKRVQYETGQLPMTWFERFFNFDLTKSGDLEYTPTPTRNAKLGAVKSLHDELIDMNDDGNKTFMEIADWIETNL